MSASALLTADETAALLRVALRTLEQWRQARRGPAYVLVGRSVRYRREDIDAWLTQRIVEPAK